MPPWVYMVGIPPYMPPYYTTLGTPPYPPWYPAPLYTAARGRSGRREEALGSREAKPVGSSTSELSGAQKCDTSYVRRAQILPAQPEELMKDWIATG